MRRKLVFTTFVVLVLYMAGVSRADMAAYWDFESDFADAIGAKGSPAAGGPGNMFFDDIRLY